MLSGHVYANDPAPMPVMPVSAPAEVSEQEMQPNFSEAYRSIGKPKITFLINKRLGKLDYDWVEADEIQDTIERFGGSSAKKARYEIEAMLASDIKRLKTDDTVDTRLAGINTAFVETMQNWEVETYDFDTVKLIDLKHSNKKEALLNELKGKVKFLGELFFYDLDLANIKVQLRIIDVTTGQLVAQSMTELTGETDLNSQNQEPEYAYIPTDKGYQKVLVNVDCKKEDRQCLKNMDSTYRSGIQLANEFMYLLVHNYE